MFYCSTFDDLLVDQRPNYANVSTLIFVSITNGDKGTRARERRQRTRKGEIYRFLKHFSDEPKMNERSTARSDVEECSWINCSRCRDEKHLQGAIFEVVLISSFEQFRCELQSSDGIKVSAVSKYIRLLRSHLHTEVSFLVSWVLILFITHGCALVSVLEVDGIFQIHSSLRMNNTQSSTSLRVKKLDFCVHRPYTDALQRIK